jgi:hypothetical protein
VSPPREAPARPAPSEAGAVPPGLVCVPVGKGCILLLSEEEYVRAIKRGKAWRRCEALQRRGERGEQG